MKFVKFLCAGALAALGVSFHVASARAEVRIDVDLTRQTMHVAADNGQTYDWPISSARAGHVTPAGVYPIEHLEELHRSKKYHNSPMPHSMFFLSGYAIHGSYETRALGRPASHGCIRLAPGNAAKLYSLVQAEGGVVSISGEPPASRPFADEAPDQAPAGGARRAARAVASEEAGPQGVFFSLFQ